MKVILTRVTTDPTMAIEEAASQCYQSKPSPNGKIMKRCYESGHVSVLEHVNFILYIEGVIHQCQNQIILFCIKMVGHCVEFASVPQSIKLHSRLLPSTDLLLASIPYQ